MSKAQTIHINIHIYIKTKSEKQFVCTCSWYSALSTIALNCLHFCSSIDMVFLGKLFSLLKRFDSQVGQFSFFPKKNNNME